MICIRFKNLIYVLCLKFTPTKWCIRLFLVANEYGVSKILFFRTWEKKAIELVELDMTAFSFG